MAARSAPKEVYSKTCIPGESRDPLVNGSTAGEVEPGFRRDAGFQLVTPSLNPL